MAKSDLELLVVDGYNVIYKTPRYTSLMDEGDAHDPFVRARELLISDVAAYAQRRYRAVVVFDAAGNVSPERPNLSKAGVKCIFSQTGESADTVIERIVSESRRALRDVTVVTSDNTIRATVGGIPVKRISSDALVSDVEELDDDMETVVRDQGKSHLTLERRLDPETRAKLDKLLGRG